MRVNIQTIFSRIESIEAKSELFTKTSSEKAVAYEIINQAPALRYLFFQCLLQHIYSACSINQECIIVGHKYKVLKTSIATALIEDKIEQAFRTQILAYWDQKELIGHNLTGGGRKNRKKKNKEFFNAYMNYTITAWNAHHSSKKGSEDKVLFKRFISEQKSRLRRVVGQICKDLTKKR